MFSERDGAAVLRRGLGGVGETGDRRRQFEDRLEIEPVPAPPWAQRRRARAPRDLSAPGSEGLGQDHRAGVSRQAASSALQQRTRSEVKAGTLWEAALIDETVHRLFPRRLRPRDPPSLLIPGPDP